MEQAGEYRVALQVGMRGFYAKVSLHVVTVPTSDSLRVDSPDALRCYGETWWKAMLDGITLAWERVRSADPSIPGMEIRHIRLDYQPVDSSRTSVGYAAAGAVLRAIGQECLLPPFQTDRTLEEIFGKPAIEDADQTAPKAEEQRHRKWPKWTRRWICDDH
jgi:hypothetical protein